MLPAASGTYTLLELSKLKAGEEFPVVSEVIHKVPELQVFPFVPRSEQYFEVSVRTGNPSASFRNTNEGIASSKATFENKSFAMQLLDSRIILDKKGIAMRAADEAARLLDQHVMGAAQAASQALVNQIWYGTKKDAKGFPGLYEIYDPTYDVNATGSSATTSVWFLEFGGEGPTVYSGNGEGLTMGEWREQLITDASGNTLEGWYNTLGGYFGLALFSKLKVVRIKNIDNGSNKLTDDLLYSGLQKCEEIGMMPNACFMSPRSRYQLRDSRTTYNPVGAPAPLPTVVPDTDVPIYSTINLSNAEETLGF
jgi:hypothetical protein